MHSRERKPGENSSDSAAKHQETSIFRSRPFKFPSASHPTSKSESSDLQRDLEKALRLNEGRKGMKAFTDRSAIPTATTPEPIQPQLTIGAPGDQYEQEADTIAQRVMSVPAPTTPGLIQPSKKPEEEPESLQTQPLASSITPLVQRDTAPVEPEENLEEEPEPVPPKLLQRAGENGSFQASSDIESQLNSNKGGGSPIPDEVRSFMEPRFGADFSGVRVHTGSAAVRMNKQLGAQAFTHGSDVYFGAGKSPGNNELMAHELTHVVQQTGSIQRFESNEHKAMGDRGSADAQGNAQKIKLADDLEVTFGDITAMAGDFFGDVKTIQDLAKVKGDGKSQPGTSDEIHYVLDVKVHKTKEDKDYDPKVISAVTGRYYKLAGDNRTHFTNPELGDDARSHEQKANAREPDKNAQNKLVPVNNAGSYRENHQRALEKACEAGKKGTSMDEAMLYEAFASHFLTDAYSSGHLRTERKGISNWWNPKVPMFWLNLKWWMAENIAKHLNDNSTIVGALTVQQLWEMSKDTLNQVVSSKGIPDLTFGDAISGAVHDMDNEVGVMATVGDEVVKLVGDGQVLDAKDRDLVVGVDTAKKAVAGVQVSLKDIHDAYALGKAGESDSAKVIESLKTKDGLFRAEQLWPSALPDSDSRQTNKKLNWKVNTVEELFADQGMRQALTHFAHEKADTLGAEINLDAPFKEEKTKAMQESVLAKLKSTEGTVIQVFKEIINYTPGSATGELGGIGGHDTDDNAVDYYKEVLKKNGALETLTFDQKFKLIRDVLDGVTIGDEQPMIVTILGAKFSDATELIKKFSWHRLWQKIDGNDCRNFVQKFGSSYWSTQSYEAKRAEVKFLADGRTNDLAQETIITILRTCSRDEVRKIDSQVGGFMGLSFDLDGKWNDEFKKMKAK